MSDSGIDTEVADPARRYDYWLGGKDNFAGDRASGEEIARIFPGIRRTVLANRAFLGRAVHHLALKRGVRQFLDIGTGLPTADNLHEIAQRVDPACRVVYVDNNRVVLAHARAILTSTTPHGITAYVEADLRDPATILKQASKTLDFTKPIALNLAAVLHFIADAEDPYRIVADLTEALPKGSYLLLSHGTTDGMDPKTIARLAARKTPDSTKETLRSRDQVNAFFTGTRLLRPGLVRADRWMPDPGAETGAGGCGELIAVWAGVAQIRPHHTRRTA